MPITVKVPIVVVLLMVAIGVAVSERVLSRLVSSQERQLGDLANAYLDGLASPLIEPVLRGDPWEIFDILDQAQAVYAAVKPVETVVTDAGGRGARELQPAARGDRLAVCRPTFRSGRITLSKVLVREADSRAFIDRQLVVEGRRSARSTPNSTSRRCSRSGARCCGR